MKVIVHGPNLRDESEGTYRVHAETSKDNAREVKMNGSLHPTDPIEVQSRVELLDHVYPADEYDREPGQEKQYLAEIHFGDSCADLPETAETTTNEGEVNVEYTTEQKDQALAAYTAKRSYRHVGRELGISADTAKNIVLAAQADAEAAKTTRTRSRSANAAPAKIDPDALAPCLFCRDEKGKAIDHPMTTEHWYVNKTTGELYTRSKCKKAEGIYRAKRRAKKAEEAAAAAKEAEKQPVAA